MKKKRRYTKIRKRRKNKLLPGLALVGFSLLLGFGAFYYFSSDFSIKGIEVAGAETVSQDEIKKAAQELFSSFIFLGKEITMDNIFVSLEGKTNKLLEEFPEIERINIKKDYAKGIVYLEVLEKEPVVAWKENGECSLLDAKGSLVRQCSDQDNLAIIEQKEEIEKLDKKEAISSVLSLKKEFEHYGLEAESFSLFIDKLVVEDLRGCDFIFSLGDNFDWQIEKMQTILNQKKYLDNLEGFQYIELRWGNQAVVKKK